MTTFPTSPKLLKGALIGLDPMNPLARSSSSSPRRMGRAQRNPSLGGGCTYNSHKGNGGWMNMVYRLITKAERKGQLLIEHIEGLRTASREVKQAHPFKMEAVVILPDSLHCSWMLPSGDDDFSTRWRQIKAAFSRQLSKIERRSKSRVQKGERGIWQRWFWEHAIRDDLDEWDL